MTLCGESDPVDVLIDDTRHTVAAESPASAPLRTPAPLLPEPTQPVGRAPDA